MFYPKMNKKNKLNMLYLTSFKYNLINNGYELGFFYDSFKQDYHKLTYNTIKLMKQELENNLNVSNNEYWNSIKEICISELKKRGRAKE